MVDCVHLHFVFGLQLEHRGVCAFPSSSPVWAECEFIGFGWIWVVEFFIPFLDLDPIKELGYDLPLENMFDLIIRTR